MPDDYLVYDMPSELNEISGITFINDSLIAAIQDENGILFFYDLSQKKLVRKFTFADDDDYEDLVRVGKDMYVVVSDGTIFEIKDFAAAIPSVNKFKTKLDKKNNIEGITYDASTNNLLLGVKDDNLDKDDKKKREKNVYSFSLKTHELEEKPTYHIKLKDIENQFKGDFLEESSKKFLKALGNENLNDIVKPSAMAFHPQTGDLYILSSINHLVVVYSKDDKFKQVIPFAGREFIQPEGLCFNSKGELYISNEGKNKAGNIIKVKTINAK